MTRRKELAYHWNLRQLMANHELWKTTELTPLLRERGVALSSAQVYRLVTDAPERLSMKVLLALCDIFQCTPNDLITPYVVEPAKPRARAAGGAPSPSPKDKRPVRARIVGPT